MSNLLQCINNRIRKILAPLEVAKNELSYIFWPLAVLLFAPLNAWISVIRPVNGGIIGTFTNGFTLTLSLSLLIPAIADYFIETFVLWRRTKKAPFFGYLVFMTIPCIFLCFVGTIYCCLAETQNFRYNIIIVIGSIIISTYVYFAGKMLCDPNMQKYRTPFYFETEKERLKKVEDDANQKKTTSLGGKEIQL